MREPLDEKYFKKLEEVIHSELQKLPSRQPPQDFIPQVLSAIQAQAVRPWWQRPWSQWPWNWQIALVAGWLVVIAISIFGGATLWQELNLNAIQTQAGSVLQSLSPFWDIGLALTNALQVLVRGLAASWLWVAVIPCALMYLACIGLGTVCYRVAYHQKY